MADCTDVRIDHQDLNTSGAGVDPAQAIYDESRGKVYFVYADQSNVFGGGSLLKNHSVFFREWDVATESFLASPVEIITTATGASGYDYPCLVRLDDGRLIVLWRYTTIPTDPDQPGLRCEASESDDDGATWSAPVTVFTTAESGGNPYALTTDGTNVWAFGWRNGAPKKLVFNKRSGVDTWGSESVIFDGTSGDTFESMELGSARPIAMVFSATEGFMCGLRYDNTNDTVKMVCMRTTDGAAFTEVVIKNYGNDETQVIIDGPRVFRGTDGRIRCAWMERNAANTTYLIVLAYSDDNGATWTYLGEIDIDTDPAHFGPSPVEWGFQIDPADRLYVSSFYVVDGVTYFRIYRGLDSIVGWELVHECTYVGLGLASSARNSTVFAGYVYLHAFQNQDVSFLRLALLTDDFTPPGGGPGPSAPEPSPSGGDENNIFARKVLGPNSGGWSLHSFQVPCWMPWDEGDSNAGREVPILTAGAVVFPALQDPALIPAINRIHAPDLYAVRVYLFSGGFKQQYDPLRMVVETKQFQLDGPHNKNVIRAIYVAYQRAGRPFTAELWVDDHLVGSWQMEDTQGRMVEKFHAVPVYSNVGARAWMRFVDESTDGLLIDSVEFVYIKKGRRGNSA